MFTNAKKVMIGGKEVQSIKVTSNNAVLYQKPDNYAISLASDVNSLVYANNDTATLTATLTNNNTPVNGKSVIFTSPYTQTYVSKTLTANTWTPVGAKYVITNLKTTFYLSPNLRIGYDPVDDEYVFETVDIDSPDARFGTRGTLHDFYVENGIVHYTRGVSTSESYDARDFDLTKVKCTSSNCVINDYGGFYSKKTTDSNGEATTYFTETNSTGTKNITAESMSKSASVQIQVT